MEGVRKKVSCHVITYNHINYISQCIDGILMQQTDFDFEIVIGDDLSTDGTRELLQKYALQYPNVIKLNLREKRGTGIPGKDNFISTFNMCDGEYISLCDGDDFWTDPLKLQKQIDFLEKNPDYVLSFHNVKEVDVMGHAISQQIVKSYSEERTYLIEDLSQKNIIHTPSVVFRKNFNKLPNWFLYSPIGDYPLHLLNALHGKIKYFPQEMASYRVGSGVWSLKTHEYRLTNTLVMLTLVINNISFAERVLDNLKIQQEDVVQALKDLPKDNNSLFVNPDSIAYNLPFKKLLIIILKKIRYFKF